MEPIVSDTTIKIEDSYLIRKRSDIRKILNALKKIYPSHPIWNRKIWTIISEWRVHNRLYSIGLYQDHTKDVDLEYPQKWYITVLYCIFGI
jgi:hypothetical protein